MSYDCCCCWIHPNYVGGRYWNYGNYLILDVTMPPVVVTVRFERHVADVTSMHYYYWLNRLVVMHHYYYYDYCGCCCSMWTVRMVV